MMRTTKGAMICALGTAAVLGLSACGGAGDGTATGTSGSGDVANKGGGKGGTLTVLSIGPKEHLDPQREYIGADILFASRTFVRTLLTYKPGSSELVPDLATDKGTQSDGGKTWKFTLADGAKWQDGKPVTCEDLKYGPSRTFATAAIKGGPNYAIQFLDIPTKKDAKGTEVPAYAGPYANDAAGQALYDKAVSCQGNTITYKFKKPWTDFDMNNAALLAFAPFRKDQDHGAKSDFEAFSNGPYMLQGTYDPTSGGTWVRNPNWDAAKDPVRKAYPDKIVDTQNVSAENQYDRLLADSGDDQTMIAGIQAPASALPKIANSATGKERAMNVDAPYVDYFAPNFKSKTMSNPKVRQAFAVATNRSAYITAYGGPSVMTPSFAMCNKALKCHKDFNPFGNDANGNPEQAKKLLTEAGVTQPLAITVGYRKRPTSDKAMASLKESWDKAGFNVTLKDFASKGYYATIQDPAQANIDVFWAGWAADWPSGSTVIPALFDSRVNITDGGSGQDYGYYSNKEVEAKMDAAFNITDSAAREQAWGDIDEMIGKDAGYVSLVNQKFTFMRGSKVKNFETNANMGGYPDLANIAVQ